MCAIAHKVGLNNAKDLRRGGDRDGRLRCTGLAHEAKRRAAGAGHTEVLVCRVLVDRQAKDDAPKLESGPIGPLSSCHLESDQLHYITLVPWEPYAVLRQKCYICNACCIVSPLRLGNLTRATTRAAAGKVGFYIG